MPHQIYLDHAATTPVHPAVIKAMLPYFAREFGNPSSPHAMGESAAEAVNEARAALARTIGAQPHELFFTSGGTEANNLALRGALGTESSKKKLVISAIEHSSIWDVAEHLKSEGYQIAVVPVDCDGLIQYAALERAIDTSTALVSIMHVNNEVGTIQNLARIGALCKRVGALFHTDAVQGFGKIPLKPGQMNVDLLTASAHKIGGPKGIGFLYARAGVDLQPLLIGGGQERGLRSGTENVPGIVGLARAAQLMNGHLHSRTRTSAEQLLCALENLGGMLHGSKVDRIPSIMNLSFADIDAEVLVQKLSRRGVYCSTRSACLSKQHRENRVLEALGIPRREREQSIRISLGRPLTSRELAAIVRAFRAGVTPS